jgi:hypothetical protein
MYTARRTSDMPLREEWLGFLNRNWEKGVFDWGLPGDVRQTYMESLIRSIYEENSAW